MLRNIQSDLHPYGVAPLVCIQLLLFCFAYKVKYNNQKFNSFVIHYYINLWHYQMIYTLQAEVSLCHGF